jgi:hypothetical protein
VHAEHDRTGHGDQKGALETLRSKTGKLGFWPALLLLLLIPLGCSEDPASNDDGGDDGGDNGGGEIRHPVDFLPPGTSGMPKDGTPTTATDTLGLQGIVNGGYEVYTNNGFQEVVEQMYAGTVGGEATTVRVWIFDMTRAQNAEALHDELLLVGTWVDTGQVGQADHRKTELLSYTILFRRGQYSARIEIYSTSQDAQDLALLFATHIDLEITS